jgi:Protein of unknown function (DUF2637)
MKEEPEMSNHGLFEITPDTDRPDIPRIVDGWTIRRLAGKDKQPGKPGSALIGWAAWLLGLLGAGLLFVSFAGQFKYIFAARHQFAPSIIAALMLDVGMIIFCLLALGLARAGKPARTERILIMVCSFGSAGMNYAASDTASPRSVVAFVAAPVFLAIVVDRVVAVIRRHVLGDDEGSAWTALGRAVLAAATLTGMIVRYSLRFTVDARETLKGLRRGIINAAPLPELHPAITAVPDLPELPPARLECWCTNPLPCLVHGTTVPELSTTKKAKLLVLYRGHRDYGNKAVASAVARELAPLADLQWGTARSYIGEELARIEATS